MILYDIQTLHGKLDSLKEIIVSFDTKLQRKGVPNSEEFNLPWPSATTSLKEFHLLDSKISIKTDFQQAVIYPFFILETVQLSLPFHLL